ncbi:MAG: hypothetical protein AAFN12_05900 [Cyanobacteria bacterium J06560_2]
MRSLPTYANLKRFFRERFQTQFLSVGDNVWFFFAVHGELHEGQPVQLKHKVERIAVTKESAWSWCLFWVESFKWGPLKNRVMLVKDLSVK